MKKIKELFKNNIKLVIGIIIGGIVFGTIGVYAATTLLSQSVYYNNTNSGATSTNVQDGLDELYTKANTWINPSYIELDKIVSTNTTKKIFATSNGACIIRKGKISCFKINNWAVEKDHAQQVFSDISCAVDSESVRCSANDFNCFVYLNGNVYIRDRSDFTSCRVTSAGAITCS